MGSLYTQHFASSRGSPLGGRRFELSYHGELAGISNTRPLFAALVKGLVSSISDAGGRDVNIVNATLIAKERGIAIDERHARDDSQAHHASAVTLRSIPASPSDGKEAEQEKVIEGYVSGNSIFISKLDKFTANFHPEGTLLVLHNYDEPGKIGNVGMVVGRHGINIRFMQVAGLGREAREKIEAASSSSSASEAKVGEVVDGPVEEGQGQESGSGLEESQRITTEALMILGVDGEVTSEVLEELRKAEGILDVSLVRL